ncbi:MULTISPECIES: type II secretion system major pseudopilin GspG [unclassified Marinovum]
MMVKNADDRAPGDAGLTLVELLVVLVVLGLISAIAVPQVMNFLGGAKTDAAKLQIDRLAGVLDVYRLDAGRYPSSDEGLQALLTQPSDVARWRGPYIDGEDALVDPWGTRFAYEVPGENGRPYSIITRGADGQPGGEGENADISN